MPDTPFDVIIIGAGPGGYVAAIRCAQLGLNTACVERQYLGGTCLNVGCIPSKALLDSSERYYAAKHDFKKHGIGVEGLSIDLSQMMKRKQEVVNALTGGVGFLFKKNKVTHLKGHGRLAGAGKVEVEGEDGTRQSYAAKSIILAPGSSPIEIPGLPFDGTHVLSSTEALDLTEVPSDLVLVGGGYIGVEIGSVWNRLGANVTVLEFMDRILPASDEEMALALQKSLAKQGLTFKFGASAKSAEVQPDGRVKVTYAAGEKSETILADKVMVAVGREPVTGDVGLDSVGIEVNPKGFIPVDDDFRTSAEGVYAIGDAIGRIMLAHNAEEEGVAAAEIIASGHGHVNYRACPSVVYTHPELAQVGVTEPEAKKLAGDHGIKVGKFPLAANGRAKGMGETEGFVKVIGDAKTDRILGIHILASHASDMIAECTVAMEFASSVEDLARSFHAHPTLPEAIKEAALAADKHAIHA